MEKTGQAGGGREYQKLRKLAAMRSSSSSSFLGEALGLGLMERFVKTADFDLEWRGVGLLGCVGARWCCVAAIWGSGGVRAYTEELAEGWGGKRVVRSLGGSGNKSRWRS